jgi:hypothetical protein
MLVKRLVSRRASRDDPSDDDNVREGDDQFVIYPHPRREIRKSTRRGEASSSQADVEAARIAEGRAMTATRDARARGELQKVEHPLKSGLEYTLRRVDRCYPRRPTNFTLGEN